MSVIVWASPSNLVCCSENFTETLIFELILGKNHEVIPKCLHPIMKQANLRDFFSFNLQTFLLSADSLHMAVFQ